MIAWLLLLTACGPARWASLHDRPFDACTAAKGTAFPLVEDDRETVAERLRKRGTLRLEVRPLSTAEVGDRLGQAPPADFDASFVWLAVRLTGASAAESTAVQLYFRDAGRPSVSFERVFGDRPEGLATGFGSTLGVPNAPSEVTSTSGGGGFILGVFGVLTGFTPLLSVMTGHDYVTPLLNDKPHTTTTAPTDAEIAAWRADPRVQAAQAVADRLAAADPGRCHGALPCVGEAFYRIDRHYDPAAPEDMDLPPRIEGFFVGLEHTVRAGDDTCLLEETVVVDTPAAPTVREQVTGTFPAGGLPLAGAEHNGVNQWRRWTDPR
jgi:hypothetical protein